MKQNKFSDISIQLSSEDNSGKICVYKKLDDLYSPKFLNLTLSGLLDISLISLSVKQHHTFLHPISIH